MCVCCTRQMHIRQEVEARAIIFDCFRASLMNASKNTGEAAGFTLREDWMASTPNAYIAAYKEALLEEEEECDGSILPYHRDMMPSIFMDTPAKTALRNIHKVRWRCATTES